MNIIAWIVVGLVAGLLARWIVHDDRSGCIYTIAVGVLGALIGGALMNASGRGGINEFSLRSLLVAALGAVLLLLVLQALGGRGRGRLRRREPPSSFRTRSFGRPMMACFLVTTNGRCISCLCLSSTATT